VTAIQIENIVKQFGSLRAVDDVTFSVEPGELFGLLGPNGAGKTTIIRIVLDIFKPDSGKVSILGGAMTEEKKDHIGYLPEERGLYQDIRLEQALAYLASLKGLTGPEARRRLDEYLERFDLAQHRKKKVKELSKGMQQKAQLIATFIHHPELVIIDEPFSGLDPVNTQMVKDLMKEQRQNGVTMVMCTHQMNQVEELCDRLVLINQGKVVLYGRLQEIQRQFASHEVSVKPVDNLPAEIPGVEARQTQNGSTLLRLSQGVSPQVVLRSLVESGTALEKFEIAVPTLDEIFIEVVQGESKSA
jgi:ABC-2 type transport system ATP-binding protein